MKGIILFLAALLLLCSGSAFAGDRVHFNPDLNGDLKLRVNKAGVTTDALTVTGSTGVVSLSLPLPVASGGGNKALTLAAGGLLWTDADSFEVGAAGTASQWALSGGTGAPTFSDNTTRGKSITGTSDQAQLTANGFAAQVEPVIMMQAAAGSNELAMRGSGGTVASPTVAVNGQMLGGIKAYGHDATNQEKSSQILMEVDGSPGNNDMPGRIRFLTTPDADVTPVERMRIDNAGRVGIGGAVAPTFPVHVRSSAVAGFTVAVENTHVDGGGYYAVASNNDNNRYLIYLETTSGERFRVGNDGAVFISDTGGIGGNVPHQCERRCTTTNSATVTSTCSAGEITTGGGCNAVNGSSAPVTSSPLSDLTAWQCTFTAANAANAVCAVCCNY